MLGHVLGQLGEMKGLQRVAFCEFTVAAGPLVESLPALHGPLF